MRKVNKELAELQESFREFYNQNLGNQFVELEKNRYKHLHFFWKWLVLFVLFTILFFYTLNQDFIPKEFFNSGLADYVIIAYFVIIYVVLRHPFDDYKSETKKLTMNKILDFFGSFNYISRNCLDMSVVEKSGLFGYFDKQTGDDYFRGTYKDIKIEVSEEKLTRQVRTKNGSRDAKVFKGVLIVLEMNKAFSGYTIVRRDWGILNFLMCAPSCKIMQQNVKLDNVKLEDCLFEKQFEVFSDDQIEARYLLTTAFMERILEVKKRFHGKEIQFSFFDNKLLIAISTSKDMFETTALFSTTVRYGRMREVVNQFYSIFSIIDLLKLNQKIGM